MGEQTDIPGGRQPSPPSDLDIPAGRIPRARHEFVEAVEERAALRGERRQPKSHAPASRKSLRLLFLAIVGVLVIAAVAAIIYVVMNIGDDRTSDVEQAVVLPSVSDDGGDLGEVEAPDQNAESDILIGELVVDDQSAGTGDTDGAATAEGTDQDAAVAVEGADTQGAAETGDGSTTIVIYQDDGASSDQDVTGEAIATDDQAAMSGSDAETDQAGSAAETGESLMMVEPEPVDEPVASAAEAPAASDEAVDEAEPDVVAETVTAAVEDTSVAAAPQAEALPVRPASSHSGPRVQIAAYGGEQRAQQGWLELKPELGDLLGDHVAVIEEAEVDSGVFYRLQIGYFNSSAEARDFCDAVLARRMDCIVIPQ